MDIKELANRVDKISENYAQVYNIQRDHDWFIFKIQEELGELTKEYLMLTERGRQKGFTKEQIRANFEEEFADVLCHVLLFANDNNIDIMKAVEKKWLKYEKNQ